VFIFFIGVCFFCLVCFGFVFFFSWVVALFFLCLCFFFVVLFSFPLGQVPFVFCHDVGLAPFVEGILCLVSRSSPGGRLSRMPPCLLDRRPFPIRNVLPEVLLSPSSAIFPMYRSAGKVMTPVSGISFSCVRFRFLEPSSVFFATVY